MHTDKYCSNPLIHEYIIIIEVWLFNYNIIAMVFIRIILFHTNNTIEYYAGVGDCFIFLDLFYTQLNYIE